MAFSRFTDRLLKLGYSRMDYIDVSGSIQENYVNGDNKVRFDKNGFFVVTENGKSLFNGFHGDPDDAVSLYNYIKLLKRKTTINKLIDGSNK
jgi:hypothetical protein